MSKIKLDRSRYFTEVHGESKHGLAAYQDGLPFNHQGELIEDLVTGDMQPLVAKKLRKIAKLEALSNPPAEGSQPSDTPSEADDDEDEEDDDDDGNVTDEVNFEQWVKDEVKYPWHIVAKAAKDRYHKVVSNAKELAEFLVYEEQLVGPDDVPTKLGKKAA